MHLDMIAKEGNIIYEPWAESFLFENYMLSILREGLLNENLANAEIQKITIDREVLACYLIHCRS